jgi:hypothetical protein
LILLVNWRYFQPESYLDNPDDFYYTDQRLIRERMSDILPDYIPAGLSLELQPSHTLVKEPVTEGVQTEIIIERMHEKLFMVSAPSSTEVVLNLADYPGWSVEINGLPVPYDVTSDGLISVPIDQGEQRVGVLLRSTPVRGVSDVISLMSFIFFFGLVVWQTSPLRQVAQKGAN